MKTRRHLERGGALLVAVVITLMVVAISGAFISHAMVRQRNSVNLMMASQAVTAAEAGAALYVQDLNKNYWATRQNPVPAVIPAPPKPYHHGFLGSSLAVSTASPDRDTLMVNPSFYRIWQEPMGANGIDDNGVDGIDDVAESTFVRLWIEGYAGGVADISNPLAPKYRGGAKRTIEVVLTHKDSKVFDFAFFAGNSSGNPYNMLFDSNQNITKDQINGDVYSGGSIHVGGTAELRDETGSGPAGRVMYKDTFKNDSSAPAPSSFQGVQPIPDIAGGNYEARAISDRYDPVKNPSGKFVNVKEDLIAYGQTANGQNNGGMNYNKDSSHNEMGRAELQIYDDNQPAHIFRKDPTTTIAANSPPRVQGYSGMKPAKDNYFLEDPTKTAKNGGTALYPWGDNANSGTNTGLRVEVKPNGNDKVYYIDGNLWASNGPAYTFQWLNSTNTDMKITIVVKGNVYLTDNLLYDQVAKATGRKDALAIIAIKDNDPKYENMSAADLTNPSSKFYNFGNMANASEQARIDYARDYNKINGSGNIFFGDPGGGTTERFESFMYAENNFYDNNLGASGTLETNIYGNMTAGNQIQINRNTGAGKWKPLKVQFDNRIRTGQVTLPGLPESPGATNESWKVVSWRQVASRPNSWGTSTAGMQFSPP
jgi:hypothetical protein